MLDAARDELCSGQVRAQFTLGIYRRASPVSEGTQRWGGGGAMTDELCIARLKLTSGERKKVGMKTVRELSASKWFTLEIPEGVYAPTTEATDTQNLFKDRGLGFPTEQKGFIGIIIMNIHRGMSMHSRKMPTKINIQTYPKKKFKISRWIRRTTKQTPRPDPATPLSPWHSSAQSQTSHLGQRSDSRLRALGALVGAFHPESASSSALARNVTIQ